MARLPTFRDPCANPSTSFRFGPPGPGAALPCLSRIPIRCQRENQRKPWASTYFRALTPNPEEAREFPIARLRPSAILVPTLHLFPDLDLADPEPHCLAHRVSGYAASAKTSENPGRPPIFAPLLPTLKRLGDFRWHGSDLLRLVPPLTSSRFGPPNPNRQCFAYRNSLARPLICVRRRADQREYVRTLATLVLNHEHQRARSPESAALVARPTFRTATVRESAVSVTVKL